VLEEQLFGRWCFVAPKESGLKEEEGMKRLQALLSTTQQDETAAEPSAKKVKTEEALTLYLAAGMSKFLESLKEANLSSIKLKIGLHPDCDT